MKIFPSLFFFSIFFCSCQDKASTADGRPIKDNKTLQTTKIQWGMRWGYPFDTASLLFAVTVCPNIKFEEAVCQLAETRASGASVRLFAQQLLVDGDTVNDAFVQTSIKKGFAIADELEPEQQKELVALTKQRKNFDHAFLTLLVRHFQRSVNFYEAGSPKMADVELKRYAIRELAVKRAHLKEAQHLLDQLKD